MGRQFRAVHQLSLLFSFLKLERKTRCLSWFEDTESACCSITSNFGKLLVSLWQITNQSAIFHTRLVSILLCFGVITAYSISQHLVNDIPALLNAVLPPAFDEPSPTSGACVRLSGARACEGWALPAPAEVRLIAKSLWIPPPEWAGISPIHNNCSCVVCQIASDFPLVFAV